MKLEKGKSFIAVGYDPDAKHLGFKVFSEAATGRALALEVENPATKTNYFSIFAITHLTKVPEVITEGSVRYVLKEGTNELFYIDLNEPMRKPPKKPKDPNAPKKPSKSQKSTEPTKLSSVKQPEVKA